MQEVEGSKRQRPLSFPTVGYMSSMGSNVLDFYREELNKHLIKAADPGEAELTLNLIFFYISISNKKRPQRDINVAS